MVKTEDSQDSFGQLRLSLSQGQSILRPMAGRDGEQELLIKLTLPKGASTFSVDYALLP